MAKKLNLTPATLSRYEKGEKKAPVELITKVLKEFEVSPDWFHFSNSPMFFPHKKNKSDIETDLIQLIEDIKKIDIEKFDLFEISIETPQPVSELVKLSTENLISLLYYIAVDKTMREQLFKVFHLLLKPEAKKRLSKINDPAAGNL